MKEFRLLYRDNVAVLNFDCNIDVGQAKSYFSVDSNGVISPTERNRHFVNIADGRQISRIFLSNKCYRSKFPGGNGCFNPRMGFLFYNKDKSKILARLDVCLECENLEFSSFTTNSTFLVNIYEHGLKKLTDLCTHLGLACCEGHRKK